MWFSSCIFLAAFLKIPLQINRTLFYEVVTKAVCMSYYGHNFICNFIKMLPYWRFIFVPSYLSWNFFFFFITISLWVHIFIQSSISTSRTFPDRCLHLSLNIKLKFLSLKQIPQIMIQSGLFQKYPKFRCSLD